MSWLWSLLVYSIPWPLQVGILAALAALVFLAAVRVLGWERVKPWLLPVIALLALIGLAQRNRQGGYTDRVAEEEKATDKAKDDFEAIHRRNEGLSEDELDKKNDPWIDRGTRH